MTITGEFKDYKINVPASIYTYLNSEKFIVEGLNLVGLPTIGGYETAEYVKYGRKIQTEVEKFITISWEENNEIDQYLTKNINCLKIHPRLLGLCLSKVDWDFISEACIENDSIIGICTYISASADEKFIINEYCSVINKLLRKGNKIIFYHAFSHLFKIFWNQYKDENVIFDTSFSLIRNFENVKHDYRAAIYEENGKICFGSDFPDYSLDNYSPYLDELFVGLTDHSKKKYLCENIKNYFKK